jgi:hypothetical protein
MMTTRKTTKPNAKKATKPKSKEFEAKTAQGYGDHRAGRRKGKVHELFDTQGADAAWTLGLKLRLKESTLRSWFATWRRPSKASPKPAAAAEANIAT